MENGRWQLFAAGHILISSIPLLQGRDGLKTIGKTKSSSIIRIIIKSAHPEAFPIFQQIS